MHFLQPPPSLSHLRSGAKPQAPLPAIVRVLGFVFREKGSVSSPFVDSRLSDHSHHITSHHITSHHIHRFTSTVSHQPFRGAKARRHGDLETRQARSQSSVYSREAKRAASQAPLSRGAIVNRTYGTNKNLHVSLFLLTILGHIYCSMVPSK